MHLTAIGISHKTAPIDIRERFYLDEVGRRLLLSELKNDPAVVEAIVLSTCNRTEIYAHTIAPAVTELLLQIQHREHAELVPGHRLRKILPEAREGLACLDRFQHESLTREKAAGYAISAGPRG